MLNCRIAFLDGSDVQFEISSFIESVSESGPSISLSNKISDVLNDDYLSKFSNLFEKEVSSLQVFSNNKEKIAEYASYKKIKTINVNVGDGEEKIDFFLQLTKE